MYVDLPKHVIADCDITSRIITSFKHYTFRAYGAEVFEELCSSSTEHVICVLLGKSPHTTLLDDVLMSFRIDCFRIIANIVRNMFRV